MTINGEGAAGTQFALRLLKKQHRALMKGGIYGNRTTVGYSLREQPVTVEVKRQNDSAYIWQCADGKGVAPDIDEAVRCALEHFLSSTAGEDSQAVPGELN